MTQLGLRGLFLLLPLISAPYNAHAGTLGVLMNQEGAPATDLVYQGRPISQDQAAELVAKDPKMDLSLLDPVVPSDIWQRGARPMSNADQGQYPADAATVRFDSYLGKVDLMFRARVLFGAGSSEKSYQLTASTLSHPALTTAALMRSLGYAVDSPQYYKKLTIQFKSVSERDDFIHNHLTLESKTGEKRFVANLPDNKEIPEVTLQDVILEPGQTDSYTYHWGRITREHIKGRRAIRGLLVPLVLADITENINLFGATIGREVNHTFLLTHRLADSYEKEITRSDLKWAARLAGRKTREDWVEIINQGKYPSDISALLVEKIISRRNDLIRSFGLKSELGIIPVNLRISTGNVINGKLTLKPDQNGEYFTNYPGYAENFDYGDAASPLRNIEQYARFPLYNSGLSQLADLIGSKLTVKSISDIQNAHFRSILDDCVQRTLRGEICAKPVAIWGGIIGGAGVSASRNIVTGNYYGGESKVQLVDNVAVTSNVGYFASKDGLPKNIQAGVLANLVRTRNFVHVRPTVDIKSAAKTPIDQINVPGYMRGLADSLMGELPANGGDPKPPEPKKLDSPFFEALEEGEMFIITDSLSSGLGINIGVPLASLLDYKILGAHPSLSLSLSGQSAIMSRTTLTRTKTGLQIYSQKINQKSLSFTVSFDWWINVLTSTDITKIGRATTDAYLLPQKFVNEGQRAKLAQALQYILRNNDLSALKQERSFDPFQLKHDLEAKINKGRFLLWQWFKLEESHQVKIRPPIKPESTIQPASIERTLFSHRLVRLKGANKQALISDLLGKAVSGIKFFPDAAGDNPSNTFLGMGQWGVWNAEAEVTPGKESDISTSIEHFWGGWSIGKNALLSILRGIEKKTQDLNLEKPLFKLEDFNNTDKLLFFNVIERLILSQDGVNQIRQHLFPRGGIQELHNTLVTFEGKSAMDGWCAMERTALRRSIGADVFRIKSEPWPSLWDDVDAAGYPIRLCVKPWMREVFEARRSVPKNLKEKVILTARLMKTLENYVPLKTRMEWAGEREVDGAKIKNYYYSVSVSGFRDGETSGKVDPEEPPKSISDYLSDSIGDADPLGAGGVFSDFAKEYGFSMHELTGKYLSEGF